MGCRCVQARVADLNSTLETNVDHLQLTNAFGVFQLASLAIW